jgi:putative ABC transport system substrate-binding protein
MNRRGAITTIGVALLSPLRLRAQESGKRRVGVLLPFRESDPEVATEFRAFRERLRTLGWTETTNLQVDLRWAPGDIAQVRQIAKELVARGPHVILTRSTPATAALLEETRSVPIVFAPVSDPVGDGFVKSLARPGGNATGFTNVEGSLGGKWLQLLKEGAPSLRNAGVLFNPRTAPGSGSFYLRSIEAAAKSLGVKILPFSVQDAAEIRNAIGHLAAQPNAGLIVLADVTNIRNRSVILETIAAHRLPAIYPIGVFSRDGGMMSYGVDVIDLYRRAASYVDRILRGADPAGMPVQGPIKFELILNMKAASRLGIALPQSLVLRADHVIQ